MNSGTAVFVLAAPPLTSGARTLGRLALAQSILGFEDFVAVNLFPLATSDVLHIARIGGDEHDWLSGREFILAGIESAADVVLAYGVSEPGGAAKLHHRHQVQWLDTQLERLRPRVWSVGHAPRHPSRWQRYTHAAFPSLPFREALARSLQLNAP